MAKTVYIYDGETGKLKRVQEPMLDPVSTEIEGHPVYFDFINSTEIAPPAVGEHEAPFFIDGAWVVKGQYKNLEVYNKETKQFEYCYSDDLGENQVFIDDPEGIERFKKNYRKYKVDETTWTIVEDPNYEKYLELEELERQLAETDEVYAAALENPVEFPANGKHYKARWVDDGTYTKILTGVLSGVITFPIDIWDATKLAENMVSMDQTTFGQLCAFLANIQNQAFEVRKREQARLIPLIEEKRRELGIEDEVAETAETEE